VFTFGRDKERLDPWSVIRHALAVGLTMGAMIMYIYPSIRATSLMYEYSMEYRKLTEMKERNKALRQRLASARSLDAVERRAVEELGFVFPAKGQVVIIAKK